MDTRMDPVSPSLATPVSRGRALRLAVGALVAAPPDSAAAHGEAAQPRNSILRNLMRLLANSPRSISRSELARVALANRASLLTGQPFAALFDEFQAFAGLEQQGEAPTTLVGTIVEELLIVPPGAVAAVRMLRAAPETQIARVAFENNSQVRLSVVIDGPGLHVTKILPPGEILESSAGIPEVAVVLATVAGEDTDGGSAWLLAVTEPLAQQQTRCQVQLNSLWCNKCVGTCTPPFICKTIRDDSCWYTWLQPTRCGCRR